MLNPDDIEITMLERGIGGQQVAVTSNAIQVKHIPSGLTVSCKRERSAFRNRELALKILEFGLKEMGYTE